MVEPGAKGELAHGQNHAHTIVDPGPPPPGALALPRRPWTLLDLIALVGAITLFMYGHETGLTLLLFWFRDGVRGGWR